MQSEFWKNKRVLVTGHTGFKGGWLCLCLHRMGANLSGYSLSATKENEFYSKVFSKGFVGEEIIADINDYSELLKCVKNSRPDIIFHLAAQPLVRYSYLNPVETFASNVMGVVNLFEVVKSSNVEPIIINITTDKVYENNESIWAYRENEKLGGNDPYSASKACSEIITNSYMKSYFKDTSVKIATVRAGNVVGGGDMSKDRLVPDYFRAFIRNEKIFLRNPKASRPWQHVLEPIHGYLKLAEKMFQHDGANYIGSWNFGPIEDPVEVGEIINKLSYISKGPGFELDTNANPHESQSLMLDSAKARKYLNWKPKLSIDETLSFTYDWFTKSIKDQEMLDFTQSQILDYQKHE